MLIPRLTADLTQLTRVSPVCDAYGEDFSPSSFKQVSLGDGRVTFPIGLSVSQHNDDTLHTFPRAVT